MLFHIREIVLELYLVACTHIIMTQVSQSTLNNPQTVKAGVECQITHECNLESPGLLTQLIGKDE